MENKNFIIAVVLSVAVMFVWSSFFAPQPEQNQSEKVDQAEKEVEKEKEQTAPIDLPETKETAAPAVIPGTDTVKHPEKTGTIKNDSLQLAFSTLGGKVTETLIIKEKYASKNVNLSLGMTKDAFFPEMSSVFGSEPGYEIESSDNSKVVLKYENSGITEIKTIEMLEDFKIRVTKKIINNTEGTLKWKPELNSVHKVRIMSCFPHTTENFPLLHRDREWNLMNLRTTRTLMNILRVEIPLTG